MTSCAAVDGAPDPRPSLRPSELPVTSAPDHSFMPNGLAGFRQQVERRTLGRCVVGLSAGDAQKAQTASYELLELDFRLACEVSGRERNCFYAVSCHLQQMLCEPSLVLARPGRLQMRRIDRHKQDEGAWGRSVGSGL